MSANPDTSARPERSGGYTLVICEKPEAAKRVAEALCSGAPQAFNVVEGVSAFRLEDASGKRYVVCAASGHLYGISDTVKERRVYPVLDLEWFPLAEIDRRAGRFVSGRIRAIQILSKEAAAFVNACDLDIEGETIGYNILKYACQGKETSALRAKFSALTKEEIVKAFNDESLSQADGMAVAGRLRHAVDFMWGVNLSRALSESSRTRESFKILSVGRVQGPTLSFVVEREEELRAFVPTPYWTIQGRFSKGDLSFEAKYWSPHILPSRRSAEAVKKGCEGREGLVSLITRSTVSEMPPPPFNLASLQKEAFRLFGYPPSKTLKIAERLYLGALISYPRTASQKLPRTDYAGLLSRIASIPGYADLANKVISEGEFQPAEGREGDPAHPAIYPTGESARRPLDIEEKRVFDLIVRRFLACFGKDMVREELSVEISVGEHVFRLEEKKVLVPGWTKFQVRQSEAAAATNAQENVAPALREGDRVKVEGITIEDYIRAPPVRYNQATLLEKMEKEGVGTKATRADIISTLLVRGYVAGQTLAPTELGFSLIEAMRDYCPQIISTHLTRDIESQLERIETSGVAGEDFFQEVVSAVTRQTKEVRLHQEEIGGSMRQSALGNMLAEVLLGKCPICKDGKLKVVRSSKSGKRFVGCTNYQKGCRASAPLPQRGAIKGTSKPCGSCGWPVVYVRAGRRPWKLCVNDRCPRKVNVYAMQDFQRKGKK